MKIKFILIFVFIQFLPSINGQVYSFYINPDFYCYELHLNHIKFVQIDTLALLKFDKSGRFVSNHIALKDKHIDQIIDFDTINKLVTYKLVDSEQGTFIKQVRYLNLSNLIHRTNIDFILDPKFKRFFIGAKIYDTIYFYRLADSYYHYDIRKIDSLDMALFYSLLYDEFGRLKTVIINYLEKPDEVREINYLYLSKSKLIVSESYSDGYRKSYYTLGKRRNFQTIKSGDNSRVTKRKCWFDTEGLIKKEVNISSIGVKEKTNYKYEKY